MKTSRKPSFNYEKDFWNKNIPVFGIDEVGRGSFAGPLVGAAVSFKKNARYKWIGKINDSKILSPKLRIRLSEQILKNAICFIEQVDVQTINKIRIGKSNSLLFKRLINKVLSKYEKAHFIVDGREIVKDVNTKFIIKGDSLSLSIAAASIIAKIYRDNLMIMLSDKYPGYDLSKNKGYGTKFHQNALSKLGLSKVHRTSFNLSKFLTT